MKVIIAEVTEDIYGRWFYGTDAYLEYEEPYAYKLYARKGDRVYICEHHWNELMSAKQWAIDNPHILRGLPDTLSFRNTEFFESGVYNMDNLYGGLTSEIKKIGELQVNQRCAFGKGPKYQDICKKYCGSTRNKC